jgi:hypothetical protein
MDEAKIKVVCDAKDFNKSVDEGIARVKKLEVELKSVKSATQTPVRINVDTSQSEQKVKDLRNQIRTLEQTGTEKSKSKGGPDIDYSELTQDVGAAFGFDERQVKTAQSLLEAIGGRLTMLVAGASAAGAAIYVAFQQMAAGSTEFTESLDKLSSVNYTTATVNDLNTLRGEAQKLIDKAKTDGSWLDWFVFGKNGKGGQLDRARAELNAIEMEMQKKRNNESAESLKARENSNDERFGDIRNSRDAELRDIEAKLADARKRAPDARGDNTARLQEMVEQKDVEIAALEATRNDGAFGQNKQKNDERLMLLKQEQENYRRAIETNKEINNLVKERAMIMQKAEEDINKKAQEEYDKRAKADAQAFDKEMEEKQKKESEATKKKLKEEKEAAEKLQNTIAGRRVGNNEYMQEQIQSATKAEREQQDKEKKQKEAEEKLRKNQEEKFNTIADEAYEKEQQLNTNKRDRLRMSMGEAAADKYSGDVGFDARRIAEDEEKAKKTKSKAERDRLQAQIDARRARMQGNEATKDQITPESLNPFGKAEAELKEMNDTLDKIEAKINTSTKGK